MTYQETSREAWRRFLADGSDTLDDHIVAALKSAGPHGLICHEIETALGRTHQAVSGNLRHLAERKKVKHTGEFGRTPSGRKAMKWTIA